VDLLPHQQSSFLQELQKGTDANEDIPLPMMKSFVAPEHAVLTSSAAFLTDLHG